MTTISEDFLIKALKDPQNATQYDFAAWADHINEQLDKARAQGHDIDNWKVFKDHFIQITIESAPDFYKGEQPA